MIQISRSDNIDRFLSIPRSLLGIFSHVNIIIIGLMYMQAISL